MDLAPLLDEELEALRQQHIGRLLQQAYRAFNQQANHKLHARGYHSLTMAHSALLANLDIAGTRITVLAERAGMTKQAMGELVGDLARQGYITRQPDAEDRRATLVRFTAQGRQFLRDAHAIKQEIEAEYAAILGAEGLQHLRAALHALLVQADPGARGGEGAPNSDS